MVPPTESLRFVAGELGKCGRNLEEIGAKFLGPNRFKVFFKTLLNAFLQVHDLGHIGKLEANLSSFKQDYSIDCESRRSSLTYSLCYNNRDSLVLKGLG